MDIDRFAEVKRNQEQHCQKKDLHRCRNDKITHAARWSSRTILQHRFREQTLAPCQSSTRGLLDQYPGALRWTMQSLFATRAGRQRGVIGCQKPSNYHSCFLLQYRLLLAAIGTDESHRY